MLNVPAIVGATPASYKGRSRTFAPRLDAPSNSVREQLAAAFLSRRLRLKLLASEAVV
jgi:hypothetical protein